jgi:hypothetical protein
MSLGAGTKASGPAVAGTPDRGQSTDQGNLAGLMLARISLLPTLLVTGWLIVGLPLVMAGIFRPAVVLALSVPVVAVAIYLGWRCLSGWPATERGTATAAGSAPWWPVIGVIVVAVAFGVDQMIFHSQFIIVTRDPASYVQFGAWLAGHGSLPIPQDNAAFGGFSHALSFQSAAYFQVGQTVVPQFMAGLPMVLAGGFWIGGVSAAVAMAPILGACALLTFGGLVARLVAPRWAPLATLALALAMPLQFTSRSTYSEPLAAILFLGGLCLVVDSLAAKGKPASILAGIGGLALGLTFLVRLDGASDILPVIPYCGLLFIARRPQAPAMVAGFAVGALYGILDGTLLTWPYLKQNMSSVSPLTKIAIAVTALTILTIIVVRIVPRVVPRLVPRRWSGRWHWPATVKVPNWLAYSLAILPVLVVLGFVIRPYVQTTRAQSVASFQSAIAAYQIAENQPIDPSRLYYETSLHWVFWYIGVPAVVLAAAGAAVLVWRCVRGGLPQWTLPLLVFSWAIVSTLYRPAITPDQPWASRRLVPAVLPGFILLAVWAVREALAWLRKRGVGATLQGALVGCCAVALVLPATITTFGLNLHASGPGGVRLAANGEGLKTTYGGEIPAVQHMCAEIPRNSSVMFIDADETKAGNQLLEVIRGMCGEPAAVLSGTPAWRVRVVIERIRRAGRVPVLLSAYQRALDKYGPSTQVMDLRTAADGETLTRPPTGTTPFNLFVWMAVPRQ